MKRNPPCESRYIECPRYKGRPKKHVDVCLKCRWKGACKSYRKFRQPELPFDASVGLQLRSSAF